MAVFAGRDISRLVLTRTRDGHAMNVTWAPTKMPAVASIAHDAWLVHFCRSLVQTSPRNARRVLVIRILLQAVDPTPRVNVMLATLETDRMGAPLAVLENTTTLEIRLNANRV